MTSHARGMASILQTVGHALFTIVKIARSKGERCLIPAQLSVRMGRVSSLTSAITGWRAKEKVGSVWQWAMLVMLVTMTSGVTAQSSSERLWLSPSPEGLPIALRELSSLRDLVWTENACAMPGVGIRFENFVPAMWKAVHTGHVRHEHAVFVYQGLRYGFKAGFNWAKMQGHRWFKNYKSAETPEGRQAIHIATRKRVDAGRTWDLGAWDDNMQKGLKAVWSRSAVFPMGGVEKPLEPGVLRPVDDHSRTGFNDASDLSFLGHTLNTYSEIAWFLQQGFFMRVSDVEAAFPMLPWHPDVWPFMLFKIRGERSEPATLYAHVTGDFGTSGMPGVFKIFFVDVVVQMARAAHVLTLPMPVYVDDLCIIGECQNEVDDQMESFHAWALLVCGVVFKAIKDKRAARRQLMLGLWWDSETLTRTLEERKLSAYVRLLIDTAAMRTVTLKQMQSLAGKMHRAILTFPPGAACLLSGTFKLMAGLMLPWHRRKPSRATRADWQMMAVMLQANMGKGYYSLAKLEAAPTVYSDASKQRRYAGGGYVSMCGRYNWWKYGNRAARRQIDLLEGDAVRVACEEMGMYWKDCWVPFGIDNTAVCGSVGKGRSSAARLDSLVRELFMLQLQGHYVLCPFWLPSKANVLADHLSRDREKEFEEAAKDPQYRWEGPLTRHGKRYEPRVLPEEAGEARTYGPAHIDALREWGQLGNGYSSNTLRDGPNAHLFELSVPYSRATLFQGLDPDRTTRLEQLLDNRLSTSSWKKISRAVTLWRVLAASEGWSPIISTDDPLRGGKLVAFVLNLVDDTELVYKSIELYVWGLRTWMQLQHQADPALGVLGWDKFMDAVKVLTWVPSEPRKETPLEVLTAIVHQVDVNSFFDVQLVNLLLVLAYTMSRAECPLPTSHEGKNSFRLNKHWCVSDFDVRVIEGRSCLCVRFKAIKQDKRMERPEAAGNEDWSVLGSMAGSEMCPVLWAQRLQKLHGRKRDPTEPYFVAPHDHAVAYLYSSALRHFKEWQEQVGVPPQSCTGLHGLRVLGYNRVKAALGVELAVAHGGWRSTAHLRYERFAMARVVRVTSAVAGEEDFSDEGEEDQKVRPTTERDQLRRRSAPQPQATTPEPQKGQRLGRSLSLASGTGKGRRRAEQRRVLQSEERKVSFAEECPRAATTGATTSTGPVFPENLEDHTVFFDRPSTRPPPRVRQSGAHAD